MNEPPAADLSKLARESYLARSDGPHNETFEGGHGIGRRLEGAPQNPWVTGKAT